MPAERDCRALLEKIMSLMDGELDERSHRDLEEHLRGCPRCEACRAILARSRSLCGERVTLSDEHLRDLFRRIIDGMKS
jgi:anti-sigma factor RsiW